MEGGNLVEGRFVYQLMALPISIGSGFGNLGIEI